MTKFSATGLLMLILLLSCSNNKKRGLTKELKSIDTNHHLATGFISNYFKFEKNSVVILPFEIEVSLSSKAKEKILKGKETIIVSASLTGKPKDSSSVQLAEDGMFYVASTNVEISYGQIAKFDKISFSKKVYDQLADKDLDLAIDIYSGRKSSEYNLLNCEILSDKISKVINKRFTLKGRLIYADE